jgi:uncharacterized membrane protein YphA (DoxX/SURF4 family)
MKFLLNSIRIIVALLFLLSGFIKAIDPLGTSFKLTEYFEEGVLNLPFLMDYALPIALFIIGLEIFLGIILLIGTQNKLIFLLLFGLIVFFSFLTFYSAYFNKVTDCGCFGDAIKLTPWESFYKNVVLFVFIVPLIFFRNLISVHFGSKLRFSLVFVTLFSSVFLAYFGLFRLPLVDFRAYKEGANIIEGMKTAKELGLPESKTQIIYTLKNKKLNKEKQVTDQEYIDASWWKKPEWEIDESKTEEKVLAKGYEPPIKDFIINCHNKEVTHDLLNEQKLVLITSYKPDNIPEEALLVLKKMKQELEKEKIKVVFVAPKPIKNTQICTMDETVLKTMIRANPGVMLIQKATILKEYHWKDLPNSEKIVLNFN